MLADGLRQRGHKVTVVSDSDSPFMDGMKYNKKFSLIDKTDDEKTESHIRLFLRYAFTNQVFIFLYGISFFPHNLDLPLLRLMGKTTIMWFVGCDIRHYIPQNEIYESTGERNLCNACRIKNECILEEKQKLVRKVEKYVTYIISGKMISQLLKRKYFVVYAPLDVENIRYNNVQNKIPKIVHAPTDRNMKGTKYIIDAVDKLKSEGYKFEFITFEKISNIAVREALSDADICVDQLFSMGNGVFANEAMAAGCAVLCGNLPEYSGRPLDLPIIHTRPENVYGNIKMLLEHPELRKELGEKGRKYVEKYHDRLKVSDTIIDIIMG